MPMPHPRNTVGSLTVFVRFHLRFPKHAFHIQPDEGIFAELQVVVHALHVILRWSNCIGQIVHMHHCEVFCSYVVAVEILQLVHPSKVFRYFYRDSHCSVSWELARSYYYSTNAM